MARNYAPLPHEYLEEMDTLSDAEFGRLCRALLQYSMAGKEGQLQGAEKVVWKRVKMQEDRFQESYKELTETRREAGKKGAAKRWHTMASDGKAMASYGKNAYTETKTETNTPPPNGGRSKRARKAHAAPPDPEDYGFGPDLAAAFDDWLKYKREKRQEYKPTGQTALVSQVRNNAAKYGETAVAALIRQCMAANWQGIIWDKLEKPAAPSGGGKTGKYTAQDFQPTAERVQKNNDWLDTFLAEQEGKGASHEAGHTLPTTRAERLHRRA